MSLINDVLREVEQRSGSRGTSSQNPPARRHSLPSRRRWPAWLFLAAACGAIVHWTLDRPKPVPDDGSRLLASADLMVPPAPAKPATLGESPAVEPSSDQTAARSVAVGTGATPARESHAPEGGATVRASGSEPAPDQTSLPGADKAAAPGHVPAAAAPAITGLDAAEAADPPPSASDEDEAPAESRISIERANVEDFGDDDLAGARRALAQGRVRVAESRLRRLIREQPGMTEAHELLAGLLLRQQRPDEAIDLLGQAVDLADRPAPLAALLGRLLIDRGQSQQARRILMTHAPPLPDEPDFHLLLAVAHRHSGDHAAAAELYRQVAELAPDNARTWIGLGASLESLDRPADAIAAYRRALDGADPQAARFARQRIDALAPVNGEH